MRYTHYGIGHPIALRKLARDCANIDPTSSPGLEENETDINEWEGDIRRRHGVCEDEGGDEDSSDEEDEELECDDDDDSGVEDVLDDEEMEVGKDADEDEEDDEEADCMLSF